jgi:hypothetical protein
MVSSQVRIIQAITEINHTFTSPDVLDLGNTAQQDRLKATQTEEAPLRVVHTCSAKLQRPLSTVNRKAIVSPL